MIQIGTWWLHVVTAVVSRVVQRCNCCDRWNTLNLISGDINSLSLGCLCSQYLTGAPSHLTVCALDNITLIFNNVGTLGTLVLESFVRMKVLVWKTAWGHPQYKVIHGQEKHFSCFCSLFSGMWFLCVQVLFCICSLGCWRSLKVFSASEILRGERAGFSGLYTKHTDVSVL